VGEGRIFTTPEVKPSPDRLVKEATKVVPSSRGKKATDTAGEVTAVFGIGTDIGKELKGMTVKVSGRSAARGLS
jgi:hypothetical protein